MLRKMTKEDYEKVYALWLATPGMGLNEKDDSREGIEKYLKRNPETCFVYEEGEEIIGVILAGHDGRRGFINHTAVREDMRERGIGSALTAAALEALKQEGINKVALVVKGDNELGNGFWESKGFTTRPDLCYRNRALVKLIRNDIK